MKRVRPVVSAPRGPYNSDALEANAWFLLTRAFVLGCDTDKPWEEFRGIFGQAGLLKLKLTLKEILLGGIRDKYWIVSHRWICPEHPDWKEDEPLYQSAKLKKLQELLRENPHIEGVWNVSIKGNRPRAMRKIEAEAWCVGDVFFMPVATQE